MQDYQRRASTRDAAQATLTGWVRDIARGGEAVVVTELGVVLALGAAPGEHVRLAGIHRRGGVVHGEVVNVLTRAAERVLPVCEHASGCGGCPLMHMSLPAQRAIKLRFVELAMGADSEAVLHRAVEAGEASLGYRRRARLRFAGDSTRLRVGFLGHASRTLVDISYCALLAPGLGAALAMARQTLSCELRGEGEMWLSHGGDPVKPVRDAVVWLRSRTPQPARAYAACELLAAAPGIAGVAMRAGGAQADAYWGDPRETALGVDGAPLQSAPWSFSQANDEVNALLVRRVVEMAAPDGARVIELYSGSGNLTVALAAHTRRLTAVEADKAAAAACSANLALRGLSATVVCADVAEHATGSHADVVVLDPPRAGASAALAGIALRRPHRVVYVSCDTAALRRDLRKLGSHGYAATEARTLDMFPQTAKVETVVLLVRAPGPRRGPSRP